jgi:hypothetical protein
MPLTGEAAGQAQALQAMGEMARMRYQSVLANKMMMETDQQQQFMESMKQLANKNQGADMATRLDQAANMAMSSGLVKQASDLSVRAALYRDRMMQLAKNQMDMQRMQVDQGRKTINIMGQLMNGVNDQASWERANYMLATMTGQKSPYADMPYSPDLVQDLQQQGMRTKDIATLALHQRNQDTLDAARQNAMDFRNARLQILLREQALREGRLDAVKKAGGRAIGAPAKGEVDAATLMLSKQFPNLPPDEVLQQAYTVASRARAIRDKNRGVDADTSMHQAITELNIQNPPGVLDKMYAWWKGTGADTPVGTVPSRPLDLPADKKLTPQTWYNTPHGVAKWNGQQFEALPSSSDLGLGDSGDEEDDNAPEGGF